MCYFAPSYHFVLPVHIEILSSSTCEGAKGDIFKTKLHFARRLLTIDIFG